MNIFSQPPMMAVSNPAQPSPPPYPLNEFHLLIANAAFEMLRNVKAPDAMIGLSCLTAMSVTCMGLISVRLPTGQVRAVSLNTLTIADSGERKTATDNLIMGEVVQRDELRAKKYVQDLADYEAEKTVWDTVKNVYTGDIAKATRNGESTDLLRDRLVEHIKAKPIKPRLRRLIRQDITRRAIADAIEGEYELIALLSNEGDIVLRSDAMRQVGLLNMIWDAASVIPLDRAQESIIARNARGTVSLMVQDAVLKDYIERHGKVVRGSGHWARYLVAWPASTQGYRFMSYTDPVWEHLPNFQARIVELFAEYDRRREAGQLEPEIIEFSEEARAEWITVANRIEADLQPMQYLSDVKDFASKSMEIAGRIAALLHKFSAQEGTISVDTFKRAFAIVDWHLHEFKRIFSPQQVVSQLQLNAQALKDYIERAYASKGWTWVKKNEVLRNGPIRNARRFNDALKCLAAMGYAGEFQNGNGKKAPWCIQINPQRFCFGQM
ncbi:YfjI family protein [Ralstonia pseudosolanacearum]|uniref:YfjI family protein n=1 Tax=Ralstonia pseudosolanacearum TaxID=1310165 RepID=UPI003AABBF84